MASDPSRIEYAGFLIDARRTQEAIDLLTQMLSEGESPTVCRLMALAYLHAGRSTDAVNMAERALSLDPESSASWGVLGRVYLGTGLSLKALECARKAVELSPQSPSAVSFLGHAYLKSGRLPESLDALEKLRSIAPDGLTTHLLAGDIANSSRQWNDAEESFRHALRIEPENLVAMNNLAVCYQRQGREADAFALFRQTARMQPGSELAANNLKSATARRLGFRAFRRRNMIIVYLAAVVIATALKLAGIIGNTAFLPLLAACLILARFVGPWLMWTVRSRALPEDVRTFFSLHMNQRKRPRRLSIALSTVGVVIAITAVGGLVQNKPTGLVPHEIHFHKVCHRISQAQGPCHFRLQSAP